MTSKIVRLTETRDWFKSSVVPKRTARAGFSLNRFYKAPRAILHGNTADPNGVCGDAAAYVVDEFYNKYEDYMTSDGYTIGLILWKGGISNHIANVMLLKNKVGPEVYEWRSSSRTVVTRSPSAYSYSSSELSGLYVYDLYYKYATTVGVWWKDRDSDMGGSVKIGQLFSIGD